MRMDDVQVGMTLQSTCGFPLLPVEVTGRTDCGFTFRAHEAEPLSLVPRLGLLMQRDGFEHYGIGGEALFSLVRDAAAA